MIHGGYICGDTFQEVFDRFRTPIAMQETIKRTLRKDGYTEKGICYAAARAEDKLCSFIGDSRFASVFINEVRKRALKPGDPRWNNKKN